VNSAHQLWSKWTITITPGAKRPDAGTVSANCARFARRIFGSASEMRVTGQGQHWRLEIRTDGAPIHDDGYVEHIRRAWHHFAVLGFGAGSITHCDVKLEAGERADSKPPDQVLMLPHVTLNPKLWKG
jgi:hypothetical protein